MGLLAEQPGIHGFLVGAGQVSRDQAEGLEEAEVYLFLMGI
jgi:hypothetical protein